MELSDNQLALTIECIKNFLQNSADTVNFSDRHDLHRALDRCATELADRGHSDPLQGNGKF